MSMPRRRKENAPGVEPGASPMVPPLLTTRASTKGTSSMILHTVSLRQVDRHRQLKAYLVHLGLQALSRGDMARIQLISELLRERRLTHE